MCSSDFLQTEKGDNHFGNSCTIFTVTIGNTVYFGNNEDYRLWGVFAWYVPAQDILTPSGTRRIHGAVFFGFDNNSDPADGYPQGGMNDQGLCLDGNALSSYTLNPHPERDPLHAATLAQVLWECSTIDDVVTWFQTHNIGTNMPYQLHFADATGDAMVVSAGPDHELAFTRIGTADFLISTNINVADPTRNVFDCWRYSTATNMLGAISSEPALTVEACRDVLDAVHQNGQYATKYSNIFNPVTRRIYLYYDRNFGQVVFTSLSYELANVRPGATGYYEQDPLFFAHSADGDMRYRQIALTSLINPSTPPLPNPSTPPLHLILLAAGIIVPVTITIVAVFYFKRRNIA